ncbi:protein sprint isoform X2 [Lucilia cuprina]|uniref:protein sprint isoform X2 n=1 Tax=Lucilia cuprina TaxID=7375 RepID=UPI001F058F27|nr:protein sprint isoform X2 [Lucilia cuprina]
MVNAVMDAIALLSSLATDLDIMLNDLRSSPSSRLSSNSHHLHTRSTATYTPFSLNIGNNSSSNNSHNTTNQSNNYLQNAAIHNSGNSNYPGNNEQKTNRDEFVGNNGECSSSNDYDDYRTNQRQGEQQQESQQQLRDNQTSASLLVTVKQEKLNQTLSANCNQQQQHFNQNLTDNGNYNKCQQQQQLQQHRFSDSNNNNNNNNCTVGVGSGTSVGKSITTTGSHDNSTDIKTTTSLSSSSTPFQGFSTDVTRISKLPLYTYQHKQLQQPQTLHIKLLQQQQATKAIASQITTTTSVAASTMAVATTDIHKQNVVNKRTLAKMNDNAGGGAGGGRNSTNNSYSNCGKNNISASNVSCRKKYNCENATTSKAASTRTTTTNPLTTTSTSSLDFRIKSIQSTSSSTSSSSSATGKSTHIYKINSSSSTSSSRNATGSTNSTSWLQSTSALTSSASTSSSATSSASATASSSSFLRSSDSSTITATSATTIATHHHSATGALLQHQQNQFQTNTTTTSSSTTTNNSNNNNNNNNNSSSLNNHQRLPFCGLDSIKGSDNNGGDGIAGGSGCLMMGGKTNLSFDLNGSHMGMHTIIHGGGSSGGIGGGISLPIDNASDQFHSLDANDSSCCGDGQFEDDMQALLPKCSRLSRDELSQSRTSLVSSSDGGILAEGETSSETSRGSDDSPPCDLSLVERLLLTHPVWFLPGIQRSGAVHFLQGKEEGNFIVRGSSQPNTMAVSVRLPPDSGPYIEHYLIQSNEGILCLESSRFKFDSIPSLIAHYAQCCDELPVQLVLPRALREAKNRQQLSSLALLGQEFWRYPMSSPKQNEQEANFLDAKSPNSMTETSGLGTTIFSNSGNSNSGGHIQSHSNKLFSPITNVNGLFSPGTPSDTNSSMSSFTTSGGQHMQLMSPESVDSVILTMSPVEMNNQRNGVLGLGGNATDIINTSTNNLSTFKSNLTTQQNNFKNSTKNIIEQEIRTQRPKPPNTLNLDLRKPPAPPLRWSKPLSPNSPVPPDVSSANNFTVTTTVTFSVDNPSTPQFVEVTTPAANNALTSVMNSNTTFQTFSKRLSPEGECKDTLSSQGSSTGSRHWQSHSSKDSNNSQRKILSPCTPTGNVSGKSRKSKLRKESKHYQESDILESPEIYCRSTLHDKISDYEDLWSHDPSDRTGLLTSFKPPDGQQGKRPDLLAETPTITSSSNNNMNVVTTPAVLTCPLLTTTASDSLNTNETTSDTQQLLKFSEESKPRSRAGLILPGLMSQSLSEDPVFKGETTEGDTTPTAQTPVSRSKQGSPFYAEPADALKQAGITTASILRRSQRGPLLPANHRHSEPPKGGFVRTPMCPLLQPAEIEKIAGSLDELKKKQQQSQVAQPQQQPTKRARGRFEQWQLDSSWEFMGKAEENEADYYGDYDSADQWKEGGNTKDNHNKENSLNREANKENKQKPLTIHQIIAKRLPDLNLPELVRCSTPPQQPQQQQQQQALQQNSHKQSSHEYNGSQKSFDGPNNTCRLSSYDNVERNYALSQCFFNGLDSAQSDDGTVFSEPWDSSQWDSFIPQDDTTINSDTIHLSKCRPALSEDDTIIEELSTKDLNNQDTLKPKKSSGKHATILRNPSIRDREILCHPRNKINLCNGGPGDTVRSYTLQLAADQCTTFARNIENFISCTKDSREAAPQVVMRNMRQFMNGMKNYLVKHGEGKFHQEVETARSRLKSDEFLNLDAILETVMHQLVVLPLREHLYGMFVDYYTRSEDIQLLAQNVKYACGRSAADFGIRPTVTPPSATSLQIISNLLLRLQEAELPLEKLELFLCVISTIFDATGCPRGQQLGADDFLPILVYVVAKCGFVGAEIEAEFMWGLLQPTLLNGEPGYYLTALCSAVHVLKSFMASENESGSGSLDWRSSSLPACSSVLRVIIPDECNGSLQTRTLPVRPHTSTREVCRIIAHKARITNPQDYALFKLVDGEETLLNESECPQDIRLAAKGKHCMLAYKRIDAKIAWPTATQPNFN